jgi:hypothetical protein
LGIVTFAVPSPPQVTGREINRQIAIPICMVRRPTAKSIGRFPRVNSFVPVSETGMATPPDDVGPEYGESGVRYPFH